MTGHDAAADGRLDRARGCLLGLAVGDALGATLEFRPPGTFAPIDDIVGGGPFDLAPGEWTDDTSMALCLGQSLLERGFDQDDQLRRYIRWRDHEYESVAGRCFDIGNTVSGALMAFESLGRPAAPTGPMTAGNGSIMRLAPVVIWAAQRTAPEVAKFAELSSPTTHGAREAIDGCRYLAVMLKGLIDGLAREEVLSPDFWASLGPEIGDLEAALWTLDRIRRGIPREWL